MEYHIIVSRKGHHYFTTAGNSFWTLGEAEDAFADFAKRFPAEEHFTLTLTRWENRGRDITKRPANDWKAI